MAKYKVITLAMAVKNNRIAEFGEFVDDAELTANPSELIKNGFLELVESEEEVAVEETEIETDAYADADASEKKVVTAKDKAKAKLTSK